MSTLVEIAAYGRRIGCEIRQRPSLDTLGTIVSAHAASIPFESLAPFTAEPVRLDIPSLQAKLIEQGRGGYCFEQNLLLKNVLEQIGFNVTGLAARVIWNAPAGLALPRTHMLLLVELEGERYIVDVGFGGLTLTGVLKLAPGLEQSTPHELFRLVADDAEYIVQAKVRGEWRSLYRFDLQPQQSVDYEPINWYLSTHPSSRFVKNLIAARVTVDRRYALLNNEFAVHFRGGETQRRAVTDADELRSVLETDFSIRVPESTAVDQALARVVQSR